MTVIREGANPTVQVGGPPIGRTFAMTLFSVGNGVMLATMVYFVVALALPLAGEPAAPPLPPFIASIGIFALIGVLAGFWSGTRRRPWFWLVAALPAALMLAFNAPFIGHDITRPAITPNFLVTIGALAGGIATIIGGIVAFREVRRGREAWSDSDRAGWVSVAAIGLVVGAAATSILAGGASAEGVGISEAPTQTGLLTAEKTAFLGTGLRMDSGEVLGLFVTNRDDVAHTFDIESLDIQVDLPAHSTTAVSIRPTGPGTLEFFCAVPGHREAGMVGTIEVGA